MKAVCPLHLASSVAFVVAVEVDDAPCYFDRLCLLLACEGCTGTLQLHFGTLCVTVDDTVLLLLHLGCLTYSLVPTLVQLAPAAGSCISEMNLVVGGDP